MKNQLKSNLIFFGWCSTAHHLWYIVGIITLVDPMPTLTQYHHPPTKSKITKKRRCARLELGKTNSKKQQENKIFTLSYKLQKLLAQGLLVNNGLQMLNFKNGNKIN